MSASSSFREAVSAPSSPLISGEVQFWRMDPNDWPRALAAVRSLGITHIATYLSWRRHEPVRGTLDLRGGHGPELDVHRFLRLSADHGFTVQLKPGPWVCAEEPGGGFPDWVMDDASLMALDHAGLPVSGYNPPFKHPMPSYASVRFRSLVREWYSRVWGELAEFTGGDGPIVATQLDNEPSLGFQDSMYGFDYHPESLLAFRSFVIDRYGSLDAVGSAWGERLAGSEDIAPPRSGDHSMAVHCSQRESDWIDYQQHYIADYLGWLRAVNEELGVGHLIDFVNLNTHPVRGMPQNGTVIASRLRSADDSPAVVGEDHYFEPPVDEDDIAGLALAAAQGAASGTSLVWAPEVQSGIWRSPGEVVGYPDPTTGDLAAWWGLSLALGYQGFNLYMLVDRENWEYAPLSPSGEPRPLAAELQRLMEQLKAVPNLAAYRPVAQVNLVWDESSRRRAYRVAGSQASPRTPWDLPAARRGYELIEAAAARLTREGIHYRLCSSPADLDPLLPTVSVDAELGDEWRGTLAAAIRFWGGDHDFGLKLKERGVSAAASAASGVTARLHRSGNGGEVLYLVPWATTAALHRVEVQLPGTRARRLVDLAGGEFPVADGSAIVDELRPGINLFRLLQ